MIAQSALAFPVGLAIGVAASAPIGPINLLVIQRALRRSVASALLLGFGGALGDAVFGAVAAFGLAAVATLLDQHAGLIRMAGGLVMLAFAVVVWRSVPRLGEAPSRQPSFRMAIVAFGMTLANPATMLFLAGSFSAVGFTGIGHDSVRHTANSALLVAGVFCGSMLWWLIVANLARSLRSRLADRHLRLLNIGTAVALALFGFAAIITGITER